MAKTILLLLEPSSKNWFVLTHLVACDADGRITSTMSLEGMLNVEERVSQHLIPAGVVAAVEVVGVDHVLLLQLQLLYQPPVNL